ncbi:hypothetical protein RB620_04515 [Paenibacillus sp. LHD-117]|uniref:DUF6906 family protein n=1 Tax=Paenibacillus sp. LHD-117 TaxID=3071412 RepID=UPI0027DFBD28|nr:hypothetical protein [Paenibacillus sp. LHD-117]MDQ6418696.1 hypothetical protein [Paenibacillus sp. LHD-117]
MKNGKKPTLRQKLAMEWAGLKSKEWLVSKVDHSKSELLIVHKDTNQQRSIPA